jgi:hypothetical protein
LEEESVDVRQVADVVVLRDEVQSLCSTPLPALEHRIGRRVDFSVTGVDGPPMAPVWRAGDFVVSGAVAKLIEGLIVL